MKKYPKNSDHFMTSLLGRWLWSWITRGNDDGGGGGGVGFGYNYIDGTYK